MENHLQVTVNVNLGSSRNLRKSYAIASLQHNILHTNSLVTEVHFMVLDAAT